MDSDRNVTQLLEEVAAGQPGAMDELVRLVYADLRRIAGRRLRERRAHGQVHVTLDPEALVHESWLRLVDQHKGFRNRAQFFSVCSMLMLRALVDHERRRDQPKRGGGRRRVTLALDFAPPETHAGAVDVSDLALALGRLDALDERKGAVARLHGLAGLSLREASEHLGVSEATIERDWAFARAWLSRELERMQAG